MWTNSLILHITPSRLNRTPAMTSCLTTECWVIWLSFLYSLHFLNWEGWVDVKPASEVPLHFKYSTVSHVGHTNLWPGNVGGNKPDNCFLPGIGECWEPPSPCSHTFTQMAPRLARAGVGKKNRIFPMFLRIQILNLARGASGWIRYSWNNLSA